MRVTLFLLLVTLGVLSSIPPVGRAAEEVPDLDEALLRAHKVGTDDASLLEFLRKRSNADQDLQNLAGVIRQLGSDQFEEREAASAKLRALGIVGIRTFREVGKARDGQIVRRGTTRLGEIDRQTRAGLLCHLELSSS
jgi:hypothetical protein